MNYSKKSIQKQKRSYIKKGYYVDNMINDSNCYEIADGNGKTLIDNLSLSQLIALSNML